MGVRSEFDPFQQKGVGLPIAMQFGPEKIAIHPRRPRLIFAVLTIVVVGWMAIIVALFFALVGFKAGVLATFCASSVVAIIVWCVYAEAFAGPYVVIEPVGRTISFPRLKRRIGYLEIRRLISGYDEEGTSDSRTGYWFLDAEVLDVDHVLRRATLLATIDRRQFRRLERDVRAALVTASEGDFGRQGS